jgi:uncharacterized membrane protein YdjX (TVP38/TMEM64 family)
MAGTGKTILTGNRKILIKALMLLLLAGTSIIFVECSPMKTYLTPERLQKIILEAGWMGPAILIFCCAAGTCAFIPGTFLIGIGAAMYGPFWGFACVWPGSLAGAAMAFLIARSLGRDFISSIIGDRLRRYDDLIERNGFTAVLFLRLMCMPFAPLSFGMGMTRVGFGDFVFGTALGSAITSSIITFFIGTLREIWISGEWGRLFSARPVLSLSILAATALFAKLARRKYESKHPPDSTGSRS